MLELPGLHADASAGASAGKRAYLRLTVLSLLVLTVAALAGAVGRTGAAVAVGFFLVALFLRIRLTETRPERRWYDGRALAESVKTLAWRYAVGGHPFPIALPSDELDRRYVAVVQRVRDSLRDTHLPPVTHGSRGAISDGMRAARQTSLDERRDLYLEDRLVDQEKWYAMRAGSHQQRYQIWAGATLVFEFAGIAGGIAVVGDYIEFDVLGLFAAAAAAAFAWVETNQYANLAHSYSNAAHELATIRDLAPHSVSEQEWANFVATAEEAISREHVTWAAAGGTATAELMRAFGRTDA